MPPFILIAQKKRSWLKRICHAHLERIKAQAIKSIYVFLTKQDAEHSVELKVLFLI